MKYNKKIIKFNKCVNRIIFKVVNTKMITAVYINNKIKTLILIILILFLIYATNKIKKYFKLSKIKLLFTNKNFR